MQIARTRVYRLLDKLLDKKLVHLKLEDRGMKFGATDPQKFQQIIVEREQQVDLLKKLLPELSASLQKISIVTGHNSKVLYYRGVEGLKQVSYNALKADKILREYRDLIKNIHRRSHFDKIIHLTGHSDIQSHTTASVGRA